MHPHLEADLKPLFDDKCALIQRWIDQGALPTLDPAHLIFSIWATTQHYADFDAQVTVLAGASPDRFEAASRHLGQMFGALLQKP